MNNATTYKQGYNTHYYEQTIPTVSTVGRVFRVDATPQRPQRNPKRQPKICTERSLANGFLNTQFLPKLQIPQEQEKLSKKAIQKREREFYTSLSQLADYYGILPMQTAHFEYPYNIALAYHNAKKQIEKVNVVNISKRLSVIEENQHLFLSVEETYDTENCLYYVPTIPVFMMLRDKKRKTTAQLLLSVCAYLYQSVDLPYYRDESTFLFWMYEIIEEWSQDDTEEYADILTALKQSKDIGDYVEKKIKNGENLSYWKHRLDRFTAKDSFDTDCFLIACKFYELYKRYPRYSLFQHLINDGDKEYDDEYEIIPMDKYVGFVANNTSVLSDQLTELVNGEFSQYTEVQEPTVFKHFNSKQKFENLEFETHIFPLINELIYLLNHYPKKVKTNE